MLTRSAIKQSFAYLLLVLFIVLIYQFVVAISDPTQQALKPQVIDTQALQSIAITESYIVDQSSDLTFEELVKTADLTFQPDLSTIPWSFDQQAYWIRYEVENLSPYPEEVTAHFSNPMLEQLDIYQLKSHQQGQEVRLTQLGWQVESLSRRDRSLPSYQIKLAANESVQLYIRIATEGIAKTPIRIYLSEDFSDLVSFTFLIWGSFVGILIAMSLYNLVLFWGLRDGIYLIYIGYITSVLMMLGVVIGFGHYIWPEGIIRFLRENIVAVNTSLMIFSVAFAILFFNAYRDRTRIVTLAMYFLIYLIAFALLSLSLPEYIAAPIFFLSMVLLYPLALALIVQQMRKNYRWARLYFISWVPLLIAGAIQPMGLTGVIKESFIVHHALMIGVLFEIVLMAMALAVRMQYKKARALYKATHEPETRLANINLLDAKAQQLLRNEERFAIIVIEIEGFSTLLPYVSNNDNNDLMLMLAKAIERKLYGCDNFVTLEHVRSQPFKVAKINEGTFAALINLSSKPIKEQERIRRQLDFLNREMASGAQVGELLINLKTKVGVSYLDEYEQDCLLGDRIKQAYQALEQAKELGESISFYQQEQAHNVAQRLTLAADLQRALRNDQLELYHQPQINLLNKQVDGSEALLRWRHEERGFIAPDTFIQLAEDTGIINELTLWVIDKACQQLEELIRRGYNHHNVSVNISGKDIAEINFLTNTREILSRYDIPLNCLTFELTESVMVNDFIHLSQTMKELSELGIQVAIDDYGTGYSSLLYISQLPFNEIKIDKSFVMNLAQSERNLTIVRTTIEMAKNLELKIVAEGIENKEVEAILEEHECRIVQGYYYQKPLPFEQYLSWLKGNVS